MKPPFTKKQIADLLGLPFRSIQFFTEQGVVVPENAAESGRGRFRLYSIRHLISLLIAGELANFGITVGEIKRVVGDFNEVLSLMVKVTEFIGYERWHQQLQSRALPLVEGCTLDLKFKKVRQGMGRALAIECTGPIETKGAVGSVEIWLCTRADGGRFTYGYRWKEGEQRFPACVDVAGNQVTEETLDTFWGANGQPKSMIYVPLGDELNRIQARLE